MKVVFNKVPNLLNVLRFHALISALLMPGLALAQPADEAPDEPKDEAPAGDAPAESEAPAKDDAPTKDNAPAEAAPAEPAPAEDDPAEPPEPIELTVAGTPIESIAGSAHVVGTKKLERFEYDDPHAVLVSVPGVYFRGEDGLGLRPNIGIRGVNPDRSKKVALMEDGIPFAPAPYSAPAAYYFPLITRMSRVRVLKGPAALSYGPQTIGGAIDLVTSPIPSTPSGRADAALGQYGYRKIHGSYGSSNQKTGFLIEGVHLANDGFKELPGDEDTGFYRNEWMFKGVHVFDPHASLPHEIRLKLGYSDELSNESYLGLTDEDFQRNPLTRYGASRLDRMQWQRTSITFTHVIDPMPNMTITTNVYRHDLARAWRKVNGFRGADLFTVLTDPQSPQNAVYYAVLTGRADSSVPGETLLIGPNQRDFASQGIETRVNWTTATGPVSHRLEYGVRLHQDRVERRHTEDGFLVQNGQLVPEGSPTITTALNEASSEALSMHVVDAVGLGRLTITPGVRAELIRSEFRDRVAQTTQGRLVDVILPGAGIHYGITSELGAFAGVYRGFSPPAPGASEDTAPELSVNYEAGARFVKRAARAELVGFYNDYSNLTDVCTLSSGCLNQNLDRQFDAGEARIYGIEASAEHEIPIGPLKIPLSVAYTLTRSEFLSSFQSDDPTFGDVESGDELPYVPQHQLSASVGVETKQVGGALGMTYVSRTREQAGSEPLSEVLATDEQLVLDASAKYRVLPPLWLYATVKNLLDSHYIVSRRPFGARPNAPRWIQVGAKVEF